MAFRGAGPEVDDGVGIDSEVFVERGQSFGKPGRHAERDRLGSGEGEEPVVPPIHDDLARILSIDLRVIGQPGLEVVLDHVDRLTPGGRDAVEVLVSGGHLEKWSARPASALRGLGEESAHHRLDLLRGVLDGPVRAPVD